MANYIPLTDRFWNGPKADWMDSVGNMFSEMKKTKTKEELAKVYADALKDPSMDASMAADESGNVKYAIGKKAPKEITPEQQAMKSFIDSLSKESEGAGLDAQANPASKPNIPVLNAMQAELGKRSELAGAEIPFAPTQTMDISRFNNPVGIFPGTKIPESNASTITSAAPLPVKKSRTQLFTERMQKEAPAGYKPNPNFMYNPLKETPFIKDDSIDPNSIGPAPEGWVINPNFKARASKEPYIKADKSDSQFPTITDITEGVIPSKYKINPKTGRPEPVEFEKKKDKPLTDDQTKSAGFVMRTEEAEKIFKNLDGYIQDQSAGKYIQSSEFLPNIWKKPQQQQYEQAQRNFVNAVLRRESGAAISPSEFENAREQYFPQPGDKADVIAQKAANRQTAIEGLRKSAGPALASMPGDADAFAALSGVSIPAQSKAYKEGDQVSINGKTYTVKIDENGRPYYEE